MNRNVLVTLIMILAFLAETAGQPLPFPEVEKNKTESENGSVNEETPYSLRSFFYKEGLSDAIQELNRIITEDSEISTELVTMIIGVVASRNKCHY